MNNFKPGKLGKVGQGCISILSKVTYRCQSLINLRRGYVNSNVPCDVFQGYLYCLVYLEKLSVLKPQGVAPYELFSKLSLGVLFITFKVLLGSLCRVYMHLNLVHAFT